MNKPQTRHGLRGTALKSRRQALGLGQVHVAREVGLRQPQLSDLEQETLGGMPRGRSADILEAMARIVAGDSAHWPKEDGRPGCGCDARTVGG